MGILQSDKFSPFIFIGLGGSGAKVALNYANNVDRAERAFAEYRATGAEGILVRASAIDEGEIDVMVTQIEQQLGPVDILVANATPQQPQRPRGRR